LPAAGRLNQTGPLPALALGERLEQVRRQGVRRRPGLGQVEGHDELRLAEKHRGHRIRICVKTNCVNQKSLLYSPVRANRAVRLWTEGGRGFLELTKRRDAVVKPI
jgi:hypothetical protein